MKHPKWRRKAITCVLCHENETQNGHGVCSSCCQLRQQGIEYQQEKERRAAGKRRYWFDGYMPIPGRSIRNYYHEQRDGIGDLIPILTASAGLPDETKSKPSVEFYLGTRDHLPHQLASAILDGQQAAALKELIRFVELLIKASYEKGVRDGSSLLVKIAQGDHTIDQYNEKRGYDED